MSLARALHEWARILGDENVLQGARLAAAMPACTTGAQAAVPALLRIDRGDAAEAHDHVLHARLIPVLRVAAEQGVPVHPISTGRNWGYGTWYPPAAPCVVLDLSALRRIRAFDAQSGCVELEPGVTQQQLRAYLDEGGHPYMVPVTGAGPECSLLGNALERGYGITPTADHFAAVLSLEAVLADGTIYRSPLVEIVPGGPGPAFKWGLGAYLDGLFTQSGMGIVTAMRIALVRRPDRVKVFVAPVPSGVALERVVDAVHDIRVRLPGLVGGINLVNARRALAMVAPYPWSDLDADGIISAPRLSALQRQYDIADWMLFGTLYGTRATVSAAGREVSRIARRAGFRPRLFTRAQLQRIESVMGFLLPERAGGAITRRVRMLRMAAELAEGTPNTTALPLAYWRHRDGRPEGDDLDPARDGCGLIWYAPLIPMRADAAREFVEFASAVLTRHRLEPLITLTTVNDNCFDSSIPLLFDRVQDPGGAAARACYEELMREGIRRGFAPYRLPLHALPALDGHGLSHGDLSARIRRALDPADIVSPGRYTPRRHIEPPPPGSVEPD